jgi:hypothetical protein
MVLGVSADIYQVSFMDEHHDKVCIGGGDCNPCEWTCAVDIDDPAEFVPATINGEPNPRARTLDCQARPQAKFEEECRGLCMVAAIPDEKGMPQGSRCQAPFDYTGCRVVGGKAWNAAFSLFLSKTTLKAFGKPGSTWVMWANGGDCTWENNPFKKKFGDDELWEGELRSAMRTAKIVWVNDLIAWSAAEGNRMLRGRHTSTTGLCATTL